MISAATEPAVEMSAADRMLVRKIGARVLPLTALLYLMAILDRANIGFAKLQMAGTLHMSEVVFGLGASLFFIGYVIFEVPSTLVMIRVGGRVWLARILITWALVTVGLAFVRGPEGFYGLRFLLGAAEAGAYPGIIYYLTLWFPQRHRVGAIGVITLGSPVGNVLGSLMGGFLLDQDGVLGLQGWQWIFIATGGASLLVGFAVLVWLPDEPGNATFLSEGDRHRLASLLRAPAGSRAADRLSWRKVLNPGTLLFAAMYAVILTSLFGVTYWLPTVIREFGVTGTQNGLLTSIPWLMSTLTLIILPRYLTDERRVLDVMIALSALGIVCFLTSIGVPGKAVKFAALAVGTPCLSVLVPCFWWLPSRAFGGHVAAAPIFATITCFGSLGGFAAQNGMPAIAAAAGAPSAAMIVPAGCLALLIVALAGLRRARSPSEPAGLRSAS